MERIGKIYDILYICEISEINKYLYFLNFGLLKNEYLTSIQKTFKKFKKILKKHLI